MALAFGLGAWRIGAGDGSSAETQEWESGHNLADMLGTLEGLTVLAARDGAFTAAELNAVMTNLAEDVRLLKGVVFTMARRTRFDAPA